MTHDERLAAIRAGMVEHKLDQLVAIHDGAHFIETPNPVFVLSRFKSLGPAAVVLPKDGEASLIVTPTWDAGRARMRSAMRIVFSMTWSTGSPARSAMHPVRSAFPARVHGMGDRQPYRAKAAAGEPRRRHRVRRRRRQDHARSPMRAGDPHRRARLPTSARDRPRHERGRAGGRAALVHKDARRRGQLPLALRRGAQSGSGTVGGRIMRAGDTLVAEITPSYRGRSRRSAAPSPRAGRPTSRPNTSCSCAMSAGIGAAVPGAPMAAVCAPSIRSWRRKATANLPSPPSAGAARLGFGSIRPATSSRQRDGAEGGWCS